MAFQKKVEDFTCDRCMASIVGDGYTNHCTACLWSKHVDVSPGDRAATCGGLMRPLALEGATPEYVIVHVCERCGLHRRNKIQSRDNKDAVLSLAASRA